jgi:hypothetical protein
MPLRFTNTVEPERVRWLWPGYIPFGKVTVVDGDPGLGKSTILIDIAARISRGCPLPNGKRHRPMGTVLLMGEDGAADTIVPRLINAEADLTKVAVRDTYTSTKEQEIPPAFPSDLPRLKEDIIEAQAGLVVIDPVMSYLDPDINSNNDQQVRRALMPLAQLAEQTGAAIVLLRHLNKSTGGSALYRGGGSIGFVGVSRSALILARDPDEPGRVVLASTKSNLGPPPPSLHFRLVGCPNGAAKIDWEGHSNFTAETLMQQQPGNEGEGTAHNEACSFLRDLLGDHLPLLAREVWKQVNEAGHARNTVLRAKNTIGVVVAKARTQDGAWTWTLPKANEDEKNPPFEAEDSSNTSDSSDSSPHNQKNLISLKSLKNPLSREEDSLSLPVAPVGGKYPCVECGKTIIRMAGAPVICQECLSTTSLAGAD